MRPFHVLAAALLVLSSATADADAGTTWVFTGRVHDG